jgi:hypothetical protein
MPIGHAWATATHLSMLQLQSVAALPLTCAPIEWTADANTACKLASSSTTTQAWPVEHSSCICNQLHRGSAPTAASVEWFILCRVNVLLSVVTTC